MMMLIVSYAVRLPLHYEKLDGGDGHYLMRNKIKIKLELDAVEYMATREM